MTLTGSRRRRRVSALEMEEISRTDVVMHQMCAIALIEFLCSVHQRLAGEAPFDA